MKFSKIDYKTLLPKQMEIFNFQKLSGVLADYGFNCIKLADDWRGADFLAYHKDGVHTLKVQLKARITIDKKFRGKNLYVSFPHKGAWYLIEHDVLIEKAKLHTKWLSTKSWKTNGCYHSSGPNKELLNSLADFEL